MQAIQNCEINITIDFFKDILLQGESILLELFRSVAVLRQSCGWDATYYSFSYWRNRLIGHVFFQKDFIDKRQHQKKTSNVGFTNI